MSNGTTTTNGDNGPLPRPRSEFLDSILGVKLPVGRDGFIRVIDYMGDDGAIVDAARNSYGAGTKRVSNNRNLLRLLMRKGHTGPFEQARIKVQLRLPLFVWQQILRTRTAQHSSVNQESNRYSEAIDSVFSVAADEWRLQSTTNKQGSGKVLDSWLLVDEHKWPTGLLGGEIEATPGEYLTSRQLELQKFAREVYEERLAFGVARELARVDIPHGTMTEVTWTCDVNNLFRFLYLRMAPDAQQETRVYADEIGSILSNWVPLTWEAFEDYQLDALTLSALEVEAIQHVMRTGTTCVLTDPKDGPMTQREVVEFRAKIERLGIRADVVKVGES